MFFYHFKKISSGRLPWPDNGYMLINSPIWQYVHTQKGNITWRKNV
jgi:hypothetical protein